MKKKGGRPTLDPVRKRTARIEIKCTLTDKFKLTQQANTAGLKVSSFVLKSALGQKVPVNHQKYLQELHALNLELARSGNNLNQLAHYANTMLKLGRLDAAIVDQLLVKLDYYSERLEQIQASFRKILRELNQSET